MLSKVQNRINEACKRANRNPNDVKLVVVTKNHSMEEIQEYVLNLGHRILGENRIQEWRRKQELENIEWHMIGSLQRNKVKYCLPFHTIHSVNSERLAAELNKFAKKHNHIFRILIEVNTSAEESKQGLEIGELDKLVEFCQNLDNIELAGLMTMAPFSNNPEDSRPYFAKLRQLRDKLGLGELSMGMSGDFEVAIEEGATIIRVGSAVFT